MTKQGAPRCHPGGKRRHSRYSPTRTFGLLLISSATALSLVAGGGDAYAAPLPAAAQDGQHVITAWGNRDSDFTPPLSLAHKSVTGISAGGGHALALTANGHVTAWGSDSQGQTDVPASLADQTVVKVVAGPATSFAITSQGTLVGWGADEYGETDVPDALGGLRVTDVSSGQGFTLALTSDGVVHAWGRDRELETDLPKSLAGKTVVAVAAGDYFSLALTSDGAVTAWGRPGYRQRDVPSSLKNKHVIAISAGAFFSEALTSDGQITAWGYDAFHATEVPASLANKPVVALDAGPNYSVALLANGRVVAWGFRYYGVTDVPPSLTGKRELAISAGGFGSLAIGPDATGPVISRSSDISLPASNTKGKRVEYPTPAATDNYDGTATVTCLPQSGSVFPLGTTTVRCSSTDQAGNESSISFSVTLRRKFFVSSISPGTGPVGGANTVTINGSGFTDADKVLFGGMRASSFTVSSDAQIVAVAPPRAAGVVHVLVQTPVVYFAPRTVANRYAYRSVVSSVSPTSGPADGTTHVIITGTGLSGTDAVEFGRTPAVQFTVVSDTTINAVAPAHDAGVTHVVTHTPGGYSAATPHNRYSFG